MLGDDAEGNDVPPGGSLVNSLLGREQERVPSLGEYTADTYPTDLAELLRRRAGVMARLLEIDTTRAAARVEAIPTLRELLREYPHPLAYEMLIHAYVDAGRYEEAKGVAFAAHERMRECARSDQPEIRSEIVGLHPWSQEEIEELRREREKAAPP
jgi:pentatricopeptide repeat protein